MCKTHKNYYATIVRVTRFYGKSKDFRKKSCRQSKRVGTGSVSHWTYGTPIADRRAGTITATGLAV